jgi:2,3,4,5-tetrahydropyridine-2-carboxylate N-succinyltransferase
MNAHPLEPIIDQAWESRDRVTPDTGGEIAIAILETLRLLDEGALRVASRGADGRWHVHHWIKKAVLLWFRLSPNTLLEGGPVDPIHGASVWYDKVRPKFAGWDDESFKRAGFRAVTGAVVRYSAFIAPDVILMPCFVNVGAHVGAGTMVDAWATVGSCAQIGRNCHLSGGVGIGGVLEPLQADPVVIEDDCFIGARSEVVEGVRVEQGSVLAMGVFLSATTRIVDRTTGEIFYGRVPPYSVVVPGSLPGKPFPDGSPGPNLACAVIVKRVDAQTRGKTSINELLRA